jgi:hypothetical protein
MKKLLFIITLLPMYVFGQFTDKTGDTIYLHKATVYSQTGVFEHNKNVGASLIVGGVTMCIGAGIHVVNSLIKLNIPDTYGELTTQDEIDNFERTKRNLNIAGWSFIGIASAAFITGGILYIKQNKLRGTVDIRVSPTSLSARYRF